MANVGELFKYLVGDAYFGALCKNSEKSNEEIIVSVFENEELINKLRTFVNDDAVIKSKLVILIGQKRKNQPQVQKPQLQTPQQEVVKEQPVFKYNPIDPSKVVYLDDFTYLEQVDHRIRLVTLDNEIYY